MNRCIRNKEEDSVVRTTMKLSPFSTTHNFCCVSLYGDIVVKSSYDDRLGRRGAGDWGK